MDRDQQVQERITQQRVEEECIFSRFSLGFQIAWGFGLVHGVRVSGLGAMSARTLAAATREVSGGTTTMKRRCPSFMINVSSRVSSPGNDPVFSRLPGTWTEYG